MAFSRIESPLKSYELSEEVRKRLFDINPSEEEHPFREYFPKNSSPQYRQAIIDTAVLYGLFGKRYIDEVKEIIKDQGLALKGHIIPRSQIHSLITQAAALKTGVIGQIISEEGKSHIRPQSGSTRQSIISANKKYSLKR